MNKIQDRIRLLSGAQLKYIAFLSMLIDHANKALIYPILDGGVLNTVSDIFDIIGTVSYTHLTGGGSLWRNAQCYRIAESGH